MKTEFDPIDTALMVAAFIGLSSMAGIATWELFGVTFAETAFDIGEGVTIATILAGGALVGTVVTNDNADLDSLGEDIKNLDQYYYGAVVLSIALLVGWVFIGDVSSFVQSEDLWGVGYVAVGVVAQIALGWML